MELGMSLLTNQCWRNLLFIHKLNTCLPGKHIFLVGARDLSEYEKRFISANGIHHLNVEEVKQKKLPLCQRGMFKIKSVRC
jgi:hypothetical protein